MYNNSESRIFSWVDPAGGGGGGTGCPDPPTPGKSCCCCYIFIGPKGPLLLEVGPNCFSREVRMYGPLAVLKYFDD